MANTVGGTLGEEDPVFLLSSLPFVTPTMEDARALYEHAQPLYEQLFAERKQKLLYAVPWPPSGIWSADAAQRRRGAEGAENPHLRQYRHRR